MAQDYFVNSITLYNVATGVLSSSNASLPGINDQIGSSDTDDGFWNNGDLLLDTALTEYRGYYEANGHIFLVFEVPFNGAMQIRSPTAPANDPGYPATVSGIPTLTTTAFATCFAEGTRITTPEGQCSVETLSIGDALVTADGGIVSVKWIGRQTVSTRFGPAERLMPVRFAAGSLGDGLPHADLTVTADHGMLVDGVICHAGALVNGESITRVPLAEMGETYPVYHIETEEHEIILANGAPAETFIDNVSRRVFDNFAEFEALYGDVPEMEELPYPRAMSARQVPARIVAQLNLALAS
ncbi:Hint domain-containing protein [Nioella aestuarii]